jgi:hypothetical protein
MTTHERTERNLDVGLHAGGEKARNQTGPEIVVRQAPGAPNSKEGPVRGALTTISSLGLAVGPWVRPATGRGWPVLLAVAAVALLVLLPTLWLYRARTTRRWKASLDAYGEREIARARYRKAPPP